MFVILNAFGSLWTENTFDTEKAAREYLEKSLPWMEPKEIPHAIVPAEEVADLHLQMEYFRDLPM